MSSSLYFRNHCTYFQVWSCGDQHDGALGRESVTENEAHLRKESSVEFANKFALIQSLTEEHFEVAQVAAGDTMGAVLNKNGDLRVWGTFVVSISYF